MSKRTRSEIGATPTPSERVLHALAALYSASAAGVSSGAQRNFLVDLKKLLKAARCEDGDAREEALQRLRALNKIVSLEGPRRDADILHRVRVPQANEAALFALTGLPSPTESRERLARQFREAQHDASVPPRWRRHWSDYCLRLAEAAFTGHSVQPFSRENAAETAEILQLLPRLLAWEGESLVRFASCVLCGDSKRLGELSARLAAALTALSGGEVRSLENLGLIENPRLVLLHGPLRLKLSGEWLDLGRLSGPFRLSDADACAAEAVETSAARCLTVENETTFHELAKLRSGVLLVCTSYPGSATLALLARLPASLECFHFGDSDPAGFDILRDLRERTGREVRSLHMRFRPKLDAPWLEATERRLLEQLLVSPALAAERDELRQFFTANSKGAFEQEGLGRPQAAWPFYP